MVEKVLLFGEINKEKAAEVISGLYEAEANCEIGKDRIDLIINSPGGAFDDALAIVACMHSLQVGIKTIGIGEVSSSALMILSNGFYREIGKNTFSITHQVYSDGSMSCFAHEMQQEVDVLTHMNKVFLDLLFTNTGTDREKLKEFILTPKDTWIKPELLLELKLVDKIINEF